ncbi:MAG: DUF2141 domain-containing protein [Pseudomonadota bacterium]
MRHLIPSSLIRAMSRGLRHGSSLPVDSLIFGALAALGLLASIGALAEEAGNPTFSVEIRNIEDPDAALYIQILAGEEAYKASTPAAAQLILPARAGSARFSLNSLPAGEYGVRVMQDLDGDGELATNMVGMPKEPWGVSNDARGRFGPPTWEQVRIVHPGEAEQIHVITLR